MENNALMISYPIFVMIGLVFVFLLYHAVKGWSAHKKLAAVLNQRHELRKQLTVKDDEIRLMRAVYEMKFEEMCGLIGTDMLPEAKLQLLKRLTQSKVAVEKAKQAGNSLVDEMQWRVNLYQSLLEKMTQS